jgi:ribonuclease BN (tRNA processing enzyme)
LLDCGYGAFASFRERAPARRLDAIVISHAHGDHAGDVEAFLSFASAWRHGPRLIASSATISALGLANREMDVVVVEDSSRVDLGTCDVECSTTAHQIPTLAARVSMGGVHVVYGADTGPGWEVPPVFRQPDLAILECTIEERDAASSRFHLDAREVAALTRIIDPRVTLVTHVPPEAEGRTRLDRARRAAPDHQFLLATTGLRIVV